LTAIYHHRIHSTDYVREFLLLEPRVVFVTVPRRIGLITSSSEVLPRVGLTTSSVEDEALPDLRLEVLEDVVVFVIFLPLKGLRTSVSSFSAERRLVVICFWMTLPLMGATSTLVSRIGLTTL
jgi:hypothetical protein